jgi:hypothetical protein
MVDPGTATIIGSVITGAISIFSTIMGAREQVVEFSDNALNNVQRMKGEYGTGLTTLCNIKNASASYLRQVDTFDFSGHIGKYPIPLQFGPGQTIAFLHTKTAGAARGSVACVVYDIIDEKPTRDSIVK